MIGYTKMTARVFLWTAMFVGGCLGHRRPHILQVIIDDLGWSDVGYHGSDLPTPNVDRLARDGIRLERYYAQPVCSPTRSAMLSGLYPFRNGMQHIEAASPATTAALPLENVTVAELLSEKGYSTHMIGKWHVGYASWKNTPLGRGFNSFRGIFQQEVDYYTHTIPQSYDFFTGEPSANLGIDLWNGTSGEDSNGRYVNDIFMEEARRVVAEVADSSRPSFMYFGFLNVHAPLQAPPNNYSACNDVTPTGRRTYCEMVAELDVSIGQLVDMYVDAGLWDNTLMIVASDNGGMGNPFEGRWPGNRGSNFPLRAGKATVFEGGVRVVSFVQGGKNVLPPYVRGTKLTSLMHAVDWFPTILHAAGVKRATPAGIDGVSQWGAMLRLSSPPRNEIPVNIVLGAQSLSSIIVGEWKLVVGMAGWYDGYLAPCPYEILPAPCSETVTTEYGSVMLFNIFDDPSERGNVAAAYPEKVAELHQRLMSYVASGYQEPQLNRFDSAANQSLHNGFWAPWLDSPAVLN
ncbi:Arylsulfatase [Diplonema papillatum]|nr:Arylsulfatase [Diplonema papillatum]